MRVNDLLYILPWILLFAACGAAIVVGAVLLVRRIVVTFFGFPEPIIAKAWAACGGRCGCQLKTHEHGDGPCEAELAWDKRGDVGEGSWYATKIKRTGEYTLENCRILCRTCVELPRAPIRVI